LELLGAPDGARDDSRPTCEDVGFLEEFDDSSGPDDEGEAPDDPFPLPW
jgi:hypothetical protein